MGIEEIIKEVGTLTPDERGRLLVALKAMKVCKSASLEEDFKKGVEVMRNACGFDFMQRRRLKEYTFCRYLLAQWLVGRGYSVLSVAHQMGYGSHSTLLYGLGSMDGTYLSKREREIKENFNILINEN